MLKIIQKFCFQPLFAEQLKEVYGILLEVINVDIEDHGLLAVRIIKDSLQKNSMRLELVMERLENFVKEQLIDFPLKVERAFSDTMTDIEGEQKGAREKIHSKDSLRLMAEIHTIILIAMGVTEIKLKPDMMKLVPDIVKALMLIPTKEKQKKHKERFIELIHAQSKLYFVIGNLIRISCNDELLVENAQKIAECSIAFLKNCPNELKQVRKIFFPVLKTIMTAYTDYFINHLDDLMNYKFLVGEYKDLKTEAASIILTVGEYAKERLTNMQSRKFIELLIQMVNDLDLSLSDQSLAISYLNKSVDVIFRSPHNVSFRTLFVFLLCIKRIYREWGDEVFEEKIITK